MSYELEINYELEQIQRWLSKTTESYEDWDWDGETLTVYTCDSIPTSMGQEDHELRTEKYSRADLIEVGAIKINI
tara:strand:+ start:4042 stop:4266 length:225 start_codon:yes stop_codon:yes gene_type:complete